MKKWEYRKGCEADFVGGHTEATHKYLHKECGHPVWTAKSEIIKEELFDLVALRELAADEDELNECIGAPEADATEQLIIERGSRYGKFKDGAEIMQELKTVMREVNGWHDLTPSQREALDMIQHKIGRILNGDPTYDDSWKDIAGYATLIVNELNGEIK